MIHACTQAIPLHHRNLISENGHIDDAAHLKIRILRCRSSKTPKLTQTLCLTFLVTFPEVRTFWGLAQTPAEHHPTPYPPRHHRISISPPISKIKMSDQRKSSLLHFHTAPTQKTPTKKSWRSRPQGRGGG